MKRSFYSFVLCCAVIFLITIYTLLLQDRNDTTFILLFLWVMLTFFLSKSKMRSKIDLLFAFFLPIAFTITRTIWVAHAASRTVGILTVDAGLFFCATDLVVVYFIWRIPCFESNVTPSRNILIAYITLALISIIFSYNATFSFAGILLYCKCYLIFEWFSRYPNSEKLRRAFISGTEIALLFQSGVALLQKITDGPIGLSFLGENDEALRYRIIDNAIDRGAAGTFEHSSRLAIFVLFVLLYLFFNEKSKKRKIIFTIIGFITLYQAGSRTAMLILALSLAYYVCRNKSKRIKKRTLFLSMCIFVIACIGVSYAFKANMFDFIFNSDLLFQVENRLNHWKVAIVYILQKPLFGYGLNNYSAYMTQFNTTNFYFLNPVHNNYLLNWFEIGIVGTICYIVLLFYNVFEIKSFKRVSEIKKSSLLFLVCVIIYNFTGWAFAAPTCIYLLFVALGLLNRKD